MRLFTPTPTPDQPGYPTQALSRLTAEVDRLSGKIDKLAETMATKTDLARYASRDMVETRWQEFERRMQETQAHLAQHDAQLTTTTRDGITRESRWDWRVIGTLGYVLTFIFGVLGTIFSGTVIGIIVWLVTNR